MFVSENKSPPTPSNKIPAEQPRQSSPGVEIQSPLQQKKAAAIDNEDHEDQDSKEDRSESGEEGPEELPIVSSPAPIRKRGKPLRTYTFVAVHNDADDGLMERSTEASRSSCEPRTDGPHTSSGGNVDKKSLKDVEKIRNALWHDDQAADAHTYTIDDMAVDSEDDSDYSPDDDLERASITSQATSGSMGRTDSDSPSEDDSDGMDEDSEDEPPSRPAAEPVTTAPMSRSDSPNQAPPDNADADIGFGFFPSEAMIEVPPQVRDDDTRMDEEPHAGSSAEILSILGLSPSPNSLSCPLTRRDTEHEPRPVIERGFGRHESEPPSLHSSPHTRSSIYSPSEAFERSSEIVPLISDVESESDVDGSLPPLSEFPQNPYAERAPAAHATPAREPIEPREQPAAFERSDNEALNPTPRPVRGDWQAFRNIHVSEAAGRYRQSVYGRNGQSLGSDAVVPHLPSLQSSIDHQDSAVWSDEPFRAIAPMPPVWTSQAPLAYNVFGEAQRPPPAPVPPHRSLPYDPYPPGFHRPAASSGRAYETPRVMGLTQEANQLHDYTDGPFRGDHHQASSRSFAGYCWYPGVHDHSHAQFDPEPSVSSSLQVHQPSTPLASRMTRVPISDIVNEAPAPAMTRSSSHQSSVAALEMDHYDGSCNQCKAAKVKCSLKTNSGPLDCERCKRYDLECNALSTDIEQRVKDAANKARAAANARISRQPSVANDASSNSGPEFASRGTKRKADDSPSSLSDLFQAATDKSDNSAAYGVSADGRLRFTLSTEVLRKHGLQYPPSKGADDELVRDVSALTNANGPNQTGTHDASPHMEQFESTDQATSDAASLFGQPEILDTLADETGCMFHSGNGNPAASLHAVTSPPREFSASPSAGAPDASAEGATSTDQHTAGSTKAPAHDSSEVPDAQPREVPLPPFTSTELHETHLPRTVESIEEPCGEPASLEPPAKRLCTPEARADPQPSYDAARRERNVAALHLMGGPRADDKVPRNGLVRLRQARQARHARQAKEAARKAKRGVFRTFFSGCLVGAATLGAAAAALIATVPDSVMQEAAKSY